MKVCSKCNNLLLLTEFGNDKYKVDNLSSACKKCNSIRQAKRDYDRREFINSFKNKPCVRCGVMYPPYVMDFHHRDPAEKAFNLSKARNKPIDKIIEEVAKCDILCANCHREVEHG